MVPVIENATKLCICVYHDNFYLMNNWVNRKKIISRYKRWWDIFIYIHTCKNVDTRRFFEKMM